MSNFPQRVWRRIPPNTLWFYSSSVAAGALNYLYNIVMARPAFLGPAQFGALAALGALLYLEGIVSSTVTTVSTNYTATLLGAGHGSQVRVMVQRVGTYVAFSGLALALLLLGGARYLARELHLASVLPIFILAPIMIITLLVGVLVGVLQGSRAFGALAAVTVLGALLRLLFALPLVAYWHLALRGALLANLASIVVVLVVIALLVQRRYPPARASSLPDNAVARITLWGYAGSVFFTVLGLTALFSIDIVLAQHYLTTTQASLYASLSTLGRIVYFATLPITLVMFPIISHRVAAGYAYRRVLLFTGTSIAIICALLGSLYVLMPSVIIHYTVGSIYAAGAADLWLYAAFFSALSIATWLAHFLLARRRMIVAFIPSLCLFFQIFFIVRNHTSAHAIISNSLMATTLLLFGLAAVAIFSPIRQSR